jgi:hypothetical protein
MSATPRASAADAYVLLRTIEVPPSADNPIGGRFETFDISAFDGTTQLYYLSDRSNMAIDIFSSRTNSLVGRIGGHGHVFTGQKATNGLSGPNGLLIVDNGAQHQVYAGNGDSTLMGFDLPAADGAGPIAKIATGTPDRNRVDEISYDPADHLILAGNNATAINFASLTNVDPGSAEFGAVRRTIALDGTQGPVGHGLEASTYNAATGTFFQAIQHIGTDAANPGGLLEIDPKTGQVKRVMDFGAAPFGSLAHCAPSGVSAAPNGRMIIGCSVASQSLVIDPAGAGAVVATFPQVSGVDETYYDRATDRWFLAARDNPGGPVLGVIDAATDAFLQTIPTSFNAHSVAVDPVSGEIFVPQGAHPSNKQCPQGCIAVFAKAQPE